LIDVADYQNGHAFYKDGYSDGGMIAFDLYNVTEEGGLRLSDKDKYVSFELCEKYRRFVLNNGDIVIVLTDMTQRLGILGKCTIVDKDNTYILNQRMGRITPKPERVIARFLKYSINSPAFLGPLHALARGTAQKYVNTDDVKNNCLLIPPLPVQRKIAATLSAYDDLIENNTRRIAILEAMAQAIYREWFVEFRFPGHEKVKLVNSPLGKIPEGWTCKELTEHGFVGRGKSRHRPRNEPSLYGGPYPFFQTGDIKEAKTFLWKYGQTYSEVGLAQSKLWEPGTLCITIAANIAETAILARKACFPDSVVGFVPDMNKSDVYYVKLFLDSIRAKMQSVSQGTTQDNLSLEKLLQFQIPSPPFSQILRFRETVTPMFQEVLTLAKKNDVLRTTRDLLLPKLISCQLDVEDLDIDTGEAAAAPLLMESF
jgi:type I restriction enzyme S subunit